jgi:hypothetical protein
MPDWEDILPGRWKLWWEKMLLAFSVGRSWAPLFSAGLACGASFIPWAVPRVAATGAALALFLIAAADIARSLADPDRGPSDPLRPRRKVPVTFFQLVLAGALAAIYSFLVLGALQPFISIVTAPAAWTTAICIPAVFVVACLTAWHNVRLWAYEGAEYEEMLEEEKNALAEKERLKQMRLPPSSWEHPRS